MLIFIPLSGNFKSVKTDFDCKTTILFKKMFHIFILNYGFINLLTYHLGIVSL